MKQVKVIVVAVLALLVLVVALQNMAPVEVRVLFARVRMAGALLVVLTGLIGFLVGVLFSLLVLRRKPAQADPSPPAAPP